MFANLMPGRIKEPLVQKAYDYWTSLTALDKWIALPPRAPDAFVNAYRDAYRSATGSAEFADLGKRISEDFEPMAYEDVDFIIRKLGETPPEAGAFISAMLRRQGIAAE